jgi:hypothetical protein
MAAVINRTDAAARRVVVEMVVTLIYLWISLCHREEHVLKPNIRVKGINILFNLIAQKTKKYPLLKERCVNFRIGI